MGEFDRSGRSEEEDFIFPFVYFPSRRSGARRCARKILGND
jgi:hypothetical protein